MSKYKMTQGDWDRIGNHVVSSFENPFNDGKIQTKSVCKISDTNEKEANGRLFAGAKELLKRADKLCEKVSAVPVGARPSGLSASLVELKEIINQITNNE